MGGRSSNDEKKGSYVIMKRQKISEVLIVKWVVKARISGNDFFSQLDTPIFSIFPIQHKLIYFPTQD